MRYDSFSQRPRSIVLQRLLQNGKKGKSLWLRPCIAWRQIGQSTFIIGCPSLLGGAFCFLGCAIGRGVRAGGSGFIAFGGRLVALLLRLGRRLVRLAPVIRLVEARTLEDDRRAAAQQPPQLPLAA